MRDRTILCIRHGESAFNAAYAGDGVDPMLFDAPLTARGRAQVEAARDRLRPVPVDVVIATPLTRALQTALGIFGDHPNRPEIVVEAGHRERLESSCDRGRAPADLAAEFPHLKLDHLPAVWWHAEGEPDGRGLHVEPLPTMLARMERFAALVKGRPEPVIALVGHGTFFFHLTGRWLDNCEVFDWPWDEAAAAALAAPTA